MASTERDPAGRIPETPGFAGSGRDSTGFSSRDRFLQVPSRSPPVQGIPTGTRPEPPGCRSLVFYSLVQQVLPSNSGNRLLKRSNFKQTSNFSTLFPIFKVIPFFFLPFLFCRYFSVPLKTWPQAIWSSFTHYILSNYTTLELITLFFFVCLAKIPFYFFPVLFGIDISDVLCGEKKK